jgi:hypothetical protein
MYYRVATQVDAVPTCMVALDLVLVSLRRLQEKLVPGPHGGTRCLNHFSRREESNYGK